MAGRTIPDGSADASSPAAAARRDPFFLAMAAAMAVTAFVGFSFTYFGPIARGAYPPTSMTVHLHGWSFFGWYLLLPVQAGLIHARRVRWHRTLGIMSAGLATVMVVTGIIVAATQIERAQAPDGSPFWAFMGLPILVLVLLFAGLYSLAVRRRRLAAQHKRLMLLASAVGLPAATFRILVQLLGFDRWVWVVGFSLPVLFLGAAMVHDRWRLGHVHRVHRIGVPTIVGIVAATFLAVPTPIGTILKQGMAWVGRAVAPIY